MGCGASAASQPVAQSSVSSAIAVAESPQAEDDELLENMQSDFPMPYAPRLSVIIETSECGSTTASQHGHSARGSQGGAARPSPLGHS